MFIIIIIAFAFDEDPGGYPLLCKDAAYSACLNVFESVLASVFIININVNILDLMCW